MNEVLLKKDKNFNLYLNKVASFSAPANRSAADGKFYVRFHSEFNFVTDKLLGRKIKLRRGYVCCNNNNRELCNLATGNLTVISCEYVRQVHVPYVV